MCLQVTNNNDVLTMKKKTSPMATESVILEDVAPEKELSITNNEDITDAEIIEDDDKFWAEENHPNFIESNTSAITFEELTNKNIIPTFSDNTLTISHQNFIGAVSKVAEQVFGELTPVECRVSHPIIGRIPTAAHKKASELREDEKTVFYQRLAWVAHVKNITRTINNQTVHLCIGGVRSYNEDKLYRPQTAMKFKLFVGWKVRVCSNLCLTCDGFSGTIECLTEADIMQKALERASYLESVGKWTFWKVHIDRTEGRDLFV